MKKNFRILQRLIFFLYFCRVFVSSADFWLIGLFSRNNLIMTTLMRSQCDWRGFAVLSLFISEACFFSAKCRKINEIRGRSHQKTERYLGAFSQYIPPELYLKPLETVGFTRKTNPQKQAASNQKYHITTQGKCFITAKSDWPSNNVAW